jgi:hypothetical protein
LPIITSSRRTIVIEAGITRTLEEGFHAQHSLSAATAKPAGSPMLGSPAGKVPPTPPKKRCVTVKPLPNGS